MIKKTTLICLVGFLGLLALCSLLYAEDDIISGSSDDSSGTNGPWDASGLLNPEEPPGYMFYEATGKEFSLPGNPYFPNLKITSSEEIHLVVDTIITNCISFHLESVANSTKTETVLTLSGLDPLWENNPDNVSYWRHQDCYAIEVIKDGEGEHTWTQDLSRHHILVGKELVLEDLVITASEDWTIQTVDSGGHSSSIALDSHGWPHISYQGSGGQLKYARWTGTVWDIQTVDSGGHSSIALDGNDRPHISYMGSGDQLKYARWIGTGWDISVVDSKGVYPSIAVDGDGNAHISYWYWITAQIGGVWQTVETKLKYWTSSTGITQELRKCWYGPSIALDSQGRPHIGFIGYWSSGWHVSYTYWTGSAWAEQIVHEEAVMDIRYPAIALDGNDRPHLSYQAVVYYPFWRTEIRYAKPTDSGWDIQTVYFFSGSYYLSDAVPLALDSDGRPHISFYRNVLIYARWDGNAWQVEVVDSAFRVGWHSSLALDSNDKPHISYDGYGDLKYATTATTNQPPECEITSPVTGTYLSETIDITFVVTDTDDDPVVVTAWIDGFEIGSITVTDTADGEIGTIPFNTTITDDNGYTIKIECDDGAGGTCTSTDVGITIDNTPPEVTSITVNPDPVQAPGLAQGGLTIDIVFSETMHTAYEPTVSYDPSGVIGPQPCTGGIWSTTTSTNDTYTVTNNNAIDNTTGDGPATVTITAAQDLAGNTSVTGTGIFIINIEKINIQNLKVLPDTFNPDPAGPGETTTISFVLSEPASAVTVAFTAPANITLVPNQPMSAGLNSIVWDGITPPSAGQGNYNLRIEADSYALNDTDTYAKINALTIDFNLPIIYNVSDAPEPFDLTLVPQSTINFSITSPKDNTISMRILDTGNNPVFTAPDQNFVAGNWIGNTFIWDGTGTLNDGVYIYELSGKTVPPAPDVANTRTGTITLLQPWAVPPVPFASDDGIVSLLCNSMVLGPSQITIDLVDASAIPGPIHAIVTAAPSQYVYPNIYRIIATPPVVFPATNPAILTFQYDPNIVGEVDQLRLCRWDTTLVPPAWADLPYRIDLANQRLIAEVTGGLSLIALFTGADTTPPVITITSPEDGKEYYNLTNGQPTIIPITYTAEDPVIDGVTSGISYTSVTLNGQVYTEDTIDLSDLFGENTLTVKAIDGSGNLARKTVRFTVVLPATVTLKPESLKVNPGVLTAFVKFPAGYNVASIIDAFCDGAKYESMELSDYGMTMVIKFRRRAVEQALAEVGETIDTEFEIKGTFQINQQTYTFKGIDTIKKVLPESVPPKKK